MTISTEPPSELKDLFLDLASFLNLPRKWTTIFNNNLTTLKKACQSDSEAIEDIIKILGITKNYRRSLEILLRKLSPICKLLDQDEWKKYHSFEAYCHDVTVALRSLFEADGVTLNIFDQEHKELVPFGWFGRPLTSFLRRRIKIISPAVTKCRPTIAWQLYKNGGTIPLSDYKHGRDVGFIQYKDAIKAGYHSGYFVALTNYSERPKSFVGIIAIHFRNKGDLIPNFHLTLLKALANKLAYILARTNWHHQSSSSPYLLTNYTVERCKEVGSTLFSPLTFMKPVICFLVLTVISAAIIVKFYFFGSPKEQISTIFIILFLTYLALIRIFLFASPEFKRSFCKEVYSLCREELMKKGRYISYTD